MHFKTFISFMLKKSNNKCPPKGAEELLILSNNNLQKIRKFIVVWNKTKK